MEYQLSQPFKLILIATAIIWFLVFMACFLLYQQLSSVSAQLGTLHTEIARLTQPSSATAQAEIISKIQQENQEIKKLLADNLQARGHTDVQLMQQIANTNKLVAQLVETMQNNVKSNERVLKQLDNTQQTLSKVANSLK